MPFDSLFVGVSGLNAYQTQIDVISNNIANVGTVGFKGQNITFQDLLYQTQGFASAPNATRGGVNEQDLGLGVKTGTIDTLFNQGGLQTTGVNTDLAINGDGFFVLKNIDGTGTPTYTRDGHFSLNQDGIVYDPSSGLAVQGYTANKNGVVQNTGVPGLLQIPLGLKQQAVGTGFGTKSGPLGDKAFDVSFGGNLDQTDYIQAVTTGNATPVTISTTIYDSLGNSHLVNVTYVPFTSGQGGVNPTTQRVNNGLGTATSVGTEWSWTISKANPTDTVVIPTASVGYVFFDQNGQFINTSGAVDPTGQTAANLHVTGQPIKQATPNQEGNTVTISNWGTQANNAASASTAATAAIALDFSLVSSLSGASTATTKSQNGYGIGTLSNITVGQDGTVTGAFTNGQAQTLGQVVLATFQNEQGLTRIGSSMFTASANSGLPQVGSAAAGRFGSIVSGSLEESNVSLADEFTKMILAQRSFEANSRSITTADQDLQTVIALKR